MKDKFNKIVGDNDVFLIASNPFFKFFNFEKAYEYHKKYPSIYIFSVYILKGDNYINIGYFNMITGELNNEMDLIEVEKNQQELNPKGKIKR